MVRLHAGASLADAAGGGAARRARALPVYEEVHPLQRYNSPRTHRRFLRHLRAVVPATCAPILVTDAGFRGPWVGEVERYGWDWIGRVRNKIKYQLEGAAWAYTTALYPQATPTPRHLGCALLSRRQPYRCQLYLVRRCRRGRGRPRKAHGQSSSARRCRKLHKDPWLLATSLPPDRGATRRVTKLYARRMQIEESIRDTKNARWGFALHYARSRCAERLELLPLIAALGTLVCWLYGLAAETRRWTRHFQVTLCAGRSSYRPSFSAGSCSPACASTPRPRVAGGLRAVPPPRCSLRECVVISWGSFRARAHFLDALL